MSPAFTFLFGLVLLILFGWYFATDHGTRKRALATILMVLLVIFSLATIYPPQKKIQLGLDIQGGTSFLIRLVQADKQITKEMLEQAVEVIRKRVDYFGGGEPVISPVGNDRILVQIPGLSTEKIQEARQQLSRVAKLEFRMVYPDNGERLRAIDAGTEVIPPEYKIETHTQHAERVKSRKWSASWSRRRPIWVESTCPARTLTTGTKVGASNCVSITKARRSSATSRRNSKASVSRSCSTA
jgi:SecD/SecF fusion protein